MKYPLNPSIFNGFNENDFDGNLIIWMKLKVSKYVPTNKDQHIVLIPPTHYKSLERTNLFQSYGLSLNRKPIELTLSEKIYFRLFQECFQGYRSKY